MDFGSQRANDRRIPSQAYSRLSDPVKGTPAHPATGCGGLHRVAAAGLGGKSAGVLPPIADRRGSECLLEARESRASVSGCSRYLNYRLRNPRVGN